VTEGQLFWDSGYLANSDPLKPQWLDDQTDFDKLTPSQEHTMREILSQVKWQDEHRDHSAENLTEEERHEIILFHSYKQDPYFKHHLRNHLR